MRELLSNLVAMPTENPPGTNLSACAELLEVQLQRTGLTCTRIAYERAEVAVARAVSDRSPDVPVALVAEYGAGPRALHFHGHYDVVPAQSPDQFQPVRKNHFLFGRGTCDMKGGLVAMLYAVRALQATGAALDGKIVLTLVPDEETGG